MYGEAIKNAIINYYLKNSNADSLVGTYTSQSLESLLTSYDIKVEYTGSRVECNKIDIYENMDVKLSECTVDGVSGDSNSTESNNYCTLSDLDTSGSITIGDKVTCDTEGFYVIENLGAGTTVTMIAEYDLDISSPASSALQSSSAGKLAFWTSEDPNYSANYGYWTDGSNTTINSNFTACTGYSYCYNSYGLKYPVNVYGISSSNTGSTSTLTSRVNGYVSLLSGMLSTSVTGRLITYNELRNLGCGEYNCNSAPSFIKQNAYWTGTASGPNAVYGVSGNSINNIVKHNNNSTFGIRPVVEFSSSVIK